jgi:hypothetical protein
MTDRGPLGQAAAARPTSEQAGLERAAREQRDAWLRTTPAQRLAWLEDAIAFAARAGAIPKPPPAAVIDPDTANG